MRVARLLFALAALAPAASAQTAADAALVDAVVESVQIDVVVGAMLGLAAETMPPELTDALDARAIEDALRTRLLADGRTDDLRAALAFAESPASAEVAARGRTLAEQAAGPDAAHDGAPDGMLADEALVRRYVVALGSAEVLSETARRALVELAEADPELAATIEAEGGTDGLMAEFTRETVGPMIEAQVLASRTALAGVPDEALEQAVAFYESPAGRYLTRVLREVLVDEMAPVMIAAAVRTMSDAPAEDPASGPAPTVPDGPFEVVDDPPELVGGLAALAQTVVYPEAARRAGVEGRVVVQFVVDETGAVRDPVAVRSDSDLLSQAAVDAVRQQRFTPGRVEGRPVKVRFAVPVTFRLTPPQPEYVPDGAGIYEIAEVQPELVGGLRGLQFAVHYPEQARRLGVQGDVVVQFVVDEEGRVRDAAVVRSPHRLLSESALAAVHRQRFRPGTVDGRPVKVRFMVPVRYRLR